MYTQPSQVLGFCSEGVGILQVKKGKKAAVKGTCLSACADGASCYELCPCSLTVPLNLVYEPCIVSDEKVKFQ